MDLDEIKRGLRAEIKERENEQYDTFQCNVSQMCKDVLAKLEEQESVIAEKNKKIQSLEYLCENYRCDCENLGIMTDKLKKSGRSLRQKMYHHKYKRCLAMARWFKIMSILAADYRVPREKWNFYEKWHNRWLELSEKFKDKETK